MDRFMNTNLTLENLDAAPQDLAQFQEEEAQKMVDALKTCLQTALVGESQNFRSWVAGAQRKFNHLQRLALATTALACLFSSLMLLASLWEGRRITGMAEAQMQYFQRQAAAPNAFAELQRANWQPVGKLITIKGRTFVELKPGK